MKKVFLNPYEQIVIGSCLKFPEDLNRLRIMLKIFSNDFIEVYDYIENFIKMYQKAPQLDVLKAEFDNLYIIDNNSSWALDEQKKLWKRNGYLDIVNNVIALFQNRDFDELKIQKEFSRYKDFDIENKTIIDINEINDYLTAPFMELQEMDSFSKYIGRGLDNPSLNVLFAATHHGKTVFSAKFAAVLAKNEIRTLVISPEMQWQVILRMIYSFYYQENVTKMETIKLNKLLNYIEICQENLSDPIGYMKSVYQQYDFLIIDSFYELSTPGDAGEEYGSQNALIRSLVNDIKIPKLITTQAKPDILSKKMGEVTENDIAFTKRAGHAADWIGYLRKDSKKSTVAIKNIKSRLRNFKIELAEVTYYSINISDGIYQEIKSSQAKYSDEDI